MVLDLAQYVLAEKFVEAAFVEAEERGFSDGYDESSLAWRGHLVCYRCKVAITLVAAVSLVSLLGFVVYLTPLP